MTVIIRRKKIIDGKVVEIPQYEPSGEYLDRDRREKANCLDEEIRKLVKAVNTEYDSFRKLKKTDYEKWYWLGLKLDHILNTVNFLDIKDIDNNCIWPAIGQYLRSELQRGYNDKRSGTNKDHFRKCWLLATLPNMEWIETWSAWDAFIDRGDQIVSSKRIIPVLGKKIFDRKIKLKAKDFQRLAKLLINNLPSKSTRIADIDSMSDFEIENIIDSALQELLSN